MSKREKSKIAGRCATVQKVKHRKAKDSRGIQPPGTRGQIGEMPDPPCSTGDQGRGGLRGGSERNYHRISSDQLITDNVASAGVDSALSSSLVGCRV